jgi:dynein heavy chain, axonemal
VKKKKEATEKSTEVEQNRKQITVEQEEAEEALRKALPDLENARQALETLDKKDITEVRSFANPPEPVQIICECVAILKGFKDISWKTAKGMLADSNFLKSLQEMNCDLITVKQVTSCRAHMKVSEWNYELRGSFELHDNYRSFHFFSFTSENNKNG